ncbi:MAG: acetate--CoA ligase family protein [Thermoplasmata archaeon]|jgi:succinyl-CoA synthetase beta subunit
MEIVEEYDVKQILKKYGINVPDGVLIKDLPERLDIEFPVVLKVSDKNILHKSDVGGVAINIKNMEELKEKFNEMKNKFPDSKFLIERMVKPGIELIIGSIYDKNFGQTIMLGIGGIFVELYKDVSFRLIPITEKDAYSIIDDLKGKRLFEGFRNYRLKKEDVVSLLLKVSQIVSDLKNVDQLDLNPIIFNEDGYFVVDAKLILR